MTELEAKVRQILAEKRMCFIATAAGNFVDNAMVAYCADGFKLYFGTFSDTLKGRNIAANPLAAVCIERVQVHGRVRLIDYNSEEYGRQVEKYLEKFPNYQDYFALEKNELYEISPLVIWYYDSSRGRMHREKIVFDHDYYERLKPYEAPNEFKKRRSDGGLTGGRK